MIPSAKTLLFTVLFLVALLGCNTKKKYDPKSYLTPSAQDSILYKISHYAVKLPPGATPETKYDHSFDAYYKKASADYRFLFVQQYDSGRIQFLIVRPAKSITPAFEGIGGNLRIDKTDSLVEYEEIFRTWKMPYEDLTERGLLLFDRMVTNRDLTIYYSKYTGDKYIEFPDDRYYYNAKEKIWSDRLVDTLKLQR